jgi:DNA polymerase epsilon subunit 1
LRFSRSHLSEDLFIFVFKVPLIVRGILKLGKTCIGEDSSMTLNRAQSIGFDLNQLDRAGASLSRLQYLDGGKAGKYIFLYHACSASAPLHVFALFLPNSNCKLHLVDPATRRQPIGRLADIYAELHQRRQNTYGPSIAMSYATSLEFSTTYHTNDATALRALSRELGLLEDMSYTVVISSSKEQSYFETLLPRLSKFPVLSMSKARAPHTLDVFPWQSHVAQKMLSRYLSLGPWLDRLISLADYYDVPVGHIDGDQPLFLSDISFARRLIQQDTILWWSPGERPDLGGIENDRGMMDDFPHTEFISPGCYSNVCLEVAVRNLAVNSVLHSVMVNELEGSGGATAFDSVSRTLDEYNNGEVQRDISLGESNVSAQTFGILKTMVKGWLLDKIQGNYESPATLAIDHFWRWISSSASHMYDSSIHRFVHSLMRKTFIQLLAEFKRLGSHVVYADFSRVLLSTSKPPGTAHAYATYITTAVLSNELFQHIYLSTERFYDFLLFMDQANMGGIICEDPLAIEAPEELSMEMRWNIGDFLPRPIQGDFSSVVQFFIVELFRIRQKTNQASRAPLRVLQNALPETTQRDAGKLKELETTREFIARRLTRKLLKVVGNIQERHRDSMMHEEQLADFEFPVLPGSHLHLTNPVLEFVKFICATFGLAREYQVEIGLLKRSLLELAGVKEFSNDATFRNPCEPLKLSNVPCCHCDGLRDFDFCRDPGLLPSNLSVSPRWLCSTCGGEYDRLVIELSLMAMLHGLECTFVQQDLTCSKCKQIQSDNVSRYCQCSGAYQFTLNKADVRRKLRTVVNVALVHNLGRLRVSTNAYECYSMT